MSEELDVGNIYEATIKGIRAQNEDRLRLAMAALMWISNAERVLKTAELCYALAVDLSSTDFNAENIPSISTVVGCCQGLIAVDKEESTVRFINPSLQEYLSSDPEIFLVREPHSEMAGICLTYLNSQHVKDLSVAFSPGAPGTPFLEYCSLYWGVHAKKGPSALVTSLALNLFQEYDGHISAKLLFEPKEHLNILNSRIDFGAGFRFSGLHCASYFGISEIVAALLEMDYDINEVDFDGSTPLTWAALSGHGEVVKMLLELEGVEPDKPDNHDGTPLFYAVESGHEGVVKLLLERKGVNPDRPDKQGRTPLAEAALCGYEGVVEILLGQAGVIPDRADNAGKTPLSHAAERGHERIVKILLAQEGVTTNKPDNCGHTPLMLAAIRKHKTVMELLSSLHFNVS